MTALPGLARDTFIVTRKSNAVDDEGNAWGTMETVGTFTGSWGTPRAVDLAVAARRGEQIDAVVATASYLNAKPDDRIESLQGRSWTVVGVEPLPGVAHVRVMLRQVT